LITNVSDDIGLANEVRVLCVPGLMLGNTSKSQAGLPWGIQWSKRDYNGWFWGTRT